MTVDLVVPLKAKVIGIGYFPQEFAFPAARLLLIGGVALFLFGSLFFHPGDSVVQLLLLLSLFSGRQRFAISLQRSPKGLAVQNDCFPGLLVI
jgi:hypothetical protein